MWPPFPMLTLYSVYPCIQVLTELLSESFGATVIPHNEIISGQSELLLIMVLPVNSRKSNTASDVVL